MTTFVALLRAVNVGGTGKLAMSDLKDALAKGIDEDQDDLDEQSEKLDDLDAALADVGKS